MPTKAPKSQNKQMKERHHAPCAILLADVEGRPDAPKKVELMRAGRYEYETWMGRELLTIDEALFSSIQTNFQANVRKIKLAVDYCHENWDKAAGWIESLELSEDGQTLSAQIEWTPEGRRAVAEKEFCYISAEFHPNYRDNETGKTYGPTLFGAGLTNRPFIKGMKHVELSENQGDEPMTEQEIKELQDTLAAAQQKNTELEAKVTELSTKVEASEKAAAEAAKKNEFDVMLSEGKVVEAQRAPFMSGDMKAFVAAAKAVNLTERGHGASGEPEGAADSKSKTPAQDKVLELAEKKQTERADLDVAQAISLVLSENAELRTQYEKEVAV